MNLLPQFHSAVITLFQESIVADDDVRPLVRVREQGNVLHELIPRNGALHGQCLFRLGSVGEVLDCGLGVGGGRSGEGESEDEEEKENASQGHRSSCNAFRKSVYVKRVPQGSKLTCKKSQGIPGKSITFVSLFPANASVVFWWVYLKPAPLLGFDGESAGARTQDQRLKRAMLYQLSYALKPHYQVSTFNQ
jgi:hypothetical protein